MVETREFPSPLEVRLGGDGRTVCGLAVPVGRPTQVRSTDYGDVQESFAPGSINTNLPSLLMFGHPAGGATAPIGSGRITEQPGGYYGAWRVDDDPLGDGVLDRVRQGQFRGLSVGFAPLPGGDLYDESRGTVIRRAVHLDHVALVDEGAYAEARVLGLRAADPKKPYGNVEYADPGYQPDGKARYPLDADHIHSAISYFSQPKNRAPYTAEQVKAIWGRIKAAAKRLGVKLAGDTGESRLAGTEARQLINARAGSPLAGTEARVLLEVRSLSPFVTDPGDGTTTLDEDEERFWRGQREILRRQVKNLDRRPF